MTLAADTQALHHGIRLAARYQLAERLERGALATVYRGQDLVLRRPIAVKAVPPEHVAAYQESLRTCARLAHPAAVGVYDAVEQDGWLFVVQEHVTGRPISAYFQQGVPPERAVDLARQTASALAYAHAHSILHGDLTPTAVLVDRHANVRINNFALPPDSDYFVRSAQAVAASLAADDPTVELPATAEVPSPTQPTDAGAAVPSPSADTRAAGYLLWQLVTEPVLGPTGADQEDGMRRFRSEIPRGLRDVVIQTIAESAQAPIADAQTLVMALERLGQELAAGRVISAPAAPPPAVLAARTAPQPAWSADDTVQGNRALVRSSGAVRPSHESAPPLPSRLANVAALSSAPRYSPSDTPARRPAVWDAPTPNRSGERRTSRADGEAYETAKEPAHRGVPLVAVLLLCAVLFILFFLVGYFSQISLH